MTRAIADTSLLIAREAGRDLAGPVPDELAVSIVSIGELRAGVLVASDTAVRAVRMATLRAAERLEPLPVDDAVATAWAVLRSTLREAGRRMPVDDSWIAATALALDVAVATQDDDFDDVPGLRVVWL